MITSVDLTEERKPDGYYFYYSVDGEKKYYFRVGNIWLKSFNSPGMIDRKRSVALNFFNEKETNDSAVV